MLSRTGTSSCGAPYGRQPAQVGRGSADRRGSVTPSPPAETGLDRLAVRGQVLHVGQGDHVRGHVAQRGLGVLDEVHAAQEGLHGQAGGVPGAAAGGQHVVGAGAVVAERHRRPGADEDRPGVADPQRPLPRRRRVWISRCSAAYASTTRSPASRSSTRTTPLCSPVSAVVTRSVCLVAGTCRASSASTASTSATDGVTSTLAASGSCSAWLIRSAATCAGSARVVGQDGDLGRPGLGVDADHAAQQPLGGGRPRCCRAR